MSTAMQKSSFSKLLPELRLAIYDQLFNDTQCYLQIYKNHVHLCRIFSRYPPLPLMLTCKFILKEVQEVLYDKTLFDVQLHMQHLPLNLQPEGTKTAVISSATGVPTEPNSWSRRYKYGFMPTLELPIKMQTFLRRVRRLQLNVWIYDSGKAWKMVESIGAFERALANDVAYQHNQRPRKLKELRIRLRLRPRGLQDDCDSMQHGEVDALVYALQQFQCAKTVEWVVERDVKPLISQHCWESELEGKVSIVV